MAETKKYTPAEMEDASRLAAAIANVPEKKRPAFVRMIEAMLIGAEVAERMASGAANQ